MEAGTLALLIPLAPFLLVAFIFWTKHQGKMAELQAKATAEKAAQYAQHTSRLEERVRVLERIVTDRGFDVAAQIEALRHEDSDKRLAAPASDTDKTVN
ncbi:hypothetical protein [Croceicoccus bisphenolivorans]|uniref:hypothetical protein n=1 Tax=Croceicoccus bisphenolivorans TaxID=1783232 RepID=UPI00082F034C|nr:hypothetical protein [Croceicoccus bisphenolivorans]